MRRIPVALTLALVVLAAACSSSDSGGEQATIGTGPRLITTSSTAPTTTVPPLPRGKGAVVTASGVVVPVLSETVGGWTVTTPCNRPATIAAGAGRYVREAMIVLDPGHGGSDPGAVSPGGLRESPVNLSVSNYARTALEEAGVSVLLTRTGDYDMELLPRAEIAKAVSARAFVSIHHNAEPDAPWPRPGSETYYQIGSNDSKRLAGLIYEEIVKALTPYNVPWMADTDAGAKYRPGNRGDYYAALRQPAPVVAVLAELAFISNPAEAALLARADVQEVEGRAVARGILRYLNTLEPGSGFTEPYPRPTPPPRTGGGPVTPPPCTDPGL